MDYYIKLTKETVKTYIKNGTILALPKKLPLEMLHRRAGVFVSIHKRLLHPTPPSKPLKRLTMLHPQEIYDGIEPPSPVEELRGCIGTYLPTQENISQEIIHNSIESATNDPRFPPLTKSELPQLIYSVDILSQPEPTTLDKLDPKKYGVIIQADDGRRGLLLPDLEGVEMVEQQILICRQKAAIFENEPITLYRFTVERHQEK